MHAFLLRIFWAFVAIIIDKNEFLNFFPFDFHSHSYLYRKWCEAHLRLFVQFCRFSESGCVSSGLFYFSVTMAVVAMLLKPVYMLFLSSEYGKRGGDVSTLFKAPTGK